MFWLELFSLDLTGICYLEGVHIACEETDSFLTKEDAEKECSLEMLVSAYILEVRPRMPMLSQGEIIGALQKGNCQATRNVVKRLVLT